MFSLSKKSKPDHQERSQKRILVRDRMLLREIPEMDAALPPSCKRVTPDLDKLYDFTIIITPEEGYWKGGCFHFHVLVTENYNFAPPAVKCLTKLWHPNISEGGVVCLSLLRQSAIDEFGWTPTRTLKDVVWGLNSLFTDLLNFTDPLNNEAAEMFQRDASQFHAKVQDYIKQYCTHS